MSRKVTIRKIVFLVIWALVITGMTSLLIAANSRQQGKLCREVFIGIKGSGEKLYVEKSDILKLLEKGAGGQLHNRPVTSVNLAMLENLLERNSWIRNAELFFDTKDALHVFVEEREPVSRIFATNGASFYIDSSGHKMSLVEKLSARVPVITGYTDIRKMRAADSAFLHEVKAVGYFIYSNDFWNAQIGQIDITPDKNFELVPVIGNHIIRLGSGKDVAAKLNRLYTFYQQVLSRAGFDKYAAIDLRFEGQVVGINKEPTSPVDSIQLQKNIEELVNKAALRELETSMLPEAMPQQNQPDTAVKTVSDARPAAQPVQAPAINRTSNPLKTATNPEKPAEQPKRRNDPARTPKAVMRAAH